MKISTKGRYALQMLTDLAAHGGDGYVPLKDVAERQSISKNYLEQIILQFKDSDWLDAARGTSGGYRLAKPPVAYSVGDIMRATEGSVKPGECPDGGDADVCAHSDSCRSVKVWRGLDRVMTEYLNSITLQDILDDSEKLQCGLI
jgi:Rrf2 family protein